MTFLIATLSPVWELVAALHLGQLGHWERTANVLPDNTIRTLAQLFCHSVPLIDGEVLVEDLEDLAPSQVPHDWVGE